MTPHVLEHLPLWVEGDLVAAAKVQVDRHLERCPTCKAAAEALRESQDWLKTPDEVPFNVEERAALRASVMGRLRNTERPSRILRLRPYALTAAAAAGLVIFLTTYIRRPPVVLRMEAPRPAVAEVQAGVAPQTVTASTARLPRIARHRPVSRPDPLPTGSGLSRIELQTQNPQIRIIWLAKCEPMPEPTPDPIKPTSEVP